MSVSTLASCMLPGLPTPHYQLGVTQQNQLFATNGHPLGDSAYPLKTWLLSPYRDTDNLSHTEEVQQASQSDTCLHWKCIRFTEGPISSPVRNTGCQASLCVRHCADCLCAAQYMPDRRQRRRRWSADWHCWCGWVSHQQHLSMVQMSQQRSNTNTSQKCLCYSNQWWAKVNWKNYNEYCNKIFFQLDQ